MNLESHPLLEKKSLGYVLLTADVDFSAEKSALFVLFHALQRMLMHPRISESDYTWMLSLVALRQIERWGKEASILEIKIMHHLRELENMKELQHGPRNAIERILKPHDEFPTSASVCINRSYARYRDKDRDLFLKEASEIEYRNLWFYMAFSHLETSNQLENRYDFGDIRKNGLLCQLDEQIQDQGLHHPGKLHDAICQNVFGIDRNAFLHERDMPIIGSAERGARLSAFITMINHLEVMSVRISREVECPLRPLDLTPQQQQVFAQVLKNIQSWNLRGLFGSDNSEHSEKASLIIQMIHEQKHPAIRQHLKNAIMRNIHEAIEVFEDIFFMTQSDPSAHFLERATEDEKRSDPIQLTPNPLFQGYSERRAM
ncbi:MAG: hypothetical protein P1V18_02590 [Candidatus Gracilibacteria bacterium]|nr:hypothetical protein [Candidatus Gracilibacteria bacterium]